VRDGLEMAFALPAGEAQWEILDAARESLRELQKNFV